MGEWKTYQLGEICKNIIDYRGKTPAKLGADWAKSGYRVFSAKNIKTGNIVQTDSIRYVDENLYRKWMKDEIERGDIIITSEAPFGEVYYWDSDEKIVLGQRLFGLKINEICYSKYLYYYMTTAQFQSELKNRATGTTVIGLRQPELLKCTVNLPPLDEQRRIAGILGSLDDKIELNRRINANLEAQAQALFRSWFVDFEPFRDGPFVDSQLGKIPNDFQIIKTGEIPMIITDFVANGSFASLKDNVTILQEEDYAYFIRNVDLKDKKFETYVNKHAYEFLSKSALFGNEIIISNVGDVGSVFLCPKLDRPMTLGNNIIMLRPKESQMLYYLYIWFKWFQGQSLIQGIKSGSAQPKFNKTDFKNLPIILPPRTTLRAFHSIIEPFFNKINFLTHENQTLSALRDTLLPKLMAGEINLD